MLSKESFNAIHSQTINIITFILITGYSTMRVKTFRFISIGFVSSLLLTAALFSSGCESTNNDEGLTLVGHTVANTEDTSTIQVTVGKHDSVYLTVTSTGTDDVYQPLTWSVNNPQLGNITKTAGTTATYDSLGTVGNNVISVKDQSGREGIAVVECAAAEETTAAE